MAKHTLTQSHRSVMREKWLDDWPFEWAEDKRLLPSNMAANIKKEKIIKRFFFIYDDERLQSINVCILDYLLATSNIEIVLFFLLFDDGTMLCCRSAFQFVWQSCVHMAISNSLLNHSCRRSILNVISFVDCGKKKLQAMTTNMTGVCRYNFLTFMNWNGPMVDIRMKIAVVWPLSGIHWAKIIFCQRSNNKINCVPSDAFCSYGGKTYKHTHSYAKNMIKNESKEKLNGEKSKREPKSNDNRIRIRNGLKFMEQFMREMCALWSLVRYLLLLSAVSKYAIDIHIFSHQLVVLFYVSLDGSLIFRHSFFFPFGVDVIVADVTVFWCKCFTRIFSIWDFLFNWNAHEYEMCEKPEQYTKIFVSAFGKYAFSFFFDFIYSNAVEAFVQTMTMSMLFIFGILRTTVSANSAILVISSTNCEWQNKLKNCRNFIPFHFFCIRFCVPITLEIHFVFVAVFPSFTLFWMHVYDRIQKYKWRRTYFIMSFNLAWQCSFAVAINSRFRVGIIKWTFVIQSTTQK